MKLIKHTLRYGLAVLIALTALSACDQNVDLVSHQERAIINISGNFLTESPDQFEITTKVLFAIDDSGSMADSDAQSLRLEAVRQFVEEYKDTENIFYEVMLWSEDVVETTRNEDNTSAFTQDVDEVIRVLDLSQDQNGTDYLETLEAIQRDIEEDILAGQSESLEIRSNYVVIFLSDGVPDPDQPDSQIFPSVEQLVEELYEQQVVGFSLNTFFLPDPNKPEIRDKAQTKLEGMAKHGEGIFKLFEDASDINFVELIDLRLTIGYKLKFLFAYNYSALPGTESLQVDSDADGLSNDDEILYNTDPFKRDTDDDGLSDFYEVTKGVADPTYDPTVVNKLCNSSHKDEFDHWLDTDKDGLTDCEEKYLETEHLAYDTDFDGIPDGIEFIAGSEPNVIDDNQDSDFDDHFDWLEIKKHTNVKANDPVLQQNYAYAYDVVKNGTITQESKLETTNVTRYKYDIGNIHLVDTAIAGRPGEYAEEVVTRPGDNLIKLFFAQVPEDEPESEPTYRVAELLINVDHKNFDIGVEPYMFELITNLDSE